MANITVPVSSLSLVGYYTTPLSLIYPVFSLSEIDTVEKFNNAVSTSNIYLAELDSYTPLSYIKGSFVGDALAQVIEMAESNENYDNIESINDNYYNRLLSVYRTQSGDTLNQGTYGIGAYNSGYFSIHAEKAKHTYQLGNIPPNTVSSTMYYSGENAAAGVILKVDNYLVRVNAVVIFGPFEGINSPNNNRAFRINVTRQTPTAQVYDDYFGIPYNTFYDIDSNFTPGTTPPIIDPFGPEGPSGPNDTPPGTFDPKSDPIPDSPIPTLSMAATGFTRIFNPTLQQVNSLAEYMWKEESVLQTLWNKVKQIFENPMDVMIAFNIVPVPVPNSSPVDFTIMYIPTGVMLSPATTQFVDVDCGTCQIQGYYGSALDYSPYTKIHCYLPYIGMVTLDTDEVMNSTLQIKYRVDIVSGGCVAKILVDGNVLYQYSGHCSISVPFSSSDFSSYMNAMLQVSAIALGAVSAGAAGAAAAGGATAANAEQQTSQVVKVTHNVKTKRNNETGRQITASTSTTTVTRPVEPEDTDTTKASYAGLDAENITNTVSSVMASKPIAQHSGSFNGNTGYLGVRYPYLVIEVPRQCLPSSYQKMNGYPSMITLNLGECSGYTRVQQVQLTGMTATNPEQAEILQLLKGGVLL